MEAFNISNLRSLTQIMKKKLAELEVTAAPQTAENYIHHLIFSTRWMLRPRYKTEDITLGLQVAGFTPEVSTAERIKYKKSDRMRAALDLWKAWDSKDPEKWPFEIERLRSMLEYADHKTLENFTEANYDMSRTNAKKYLDSINPFGRYRPRPPEMVYKTRKPRIRLND